MNLKLEVHAVNQLNTIVNAEINNVLPQLQKYIGKVIKIQTGFSKKFTIDFLKLKPEGFEGKWADNQLCYLSCDYSSMYLHVSICLSVDDNSCQYWKKEVYLGQCDKSGVLTEIVEKRTYPIVDVEAVKTEIDKYMEAQKICDMIKSQLPINPEFLKYGYDKI